MNLSGFRPPVDAMLDMRSTIITFKSIEEHIHELYGMLKLFPDNDEEYLKIRSELDKYRIYHYYLTHTNKKFLKYIAKKNLHDGDKQIIIDLNRKWFCVESL